MNILLLTSDYYPRSSGIANHIYYLAKYLRLHNINTKIVHLQDKKGGKNEKSYGDHVVKIDLARSFNIKSILNFKAKKIVIGHLNEIIKKYNLDRKNTILHTHELLKYELVASRYKIPWVWTNHTSGFADIVYNKSIKNTIKKHFTKTVYQRANAIINISRELYKVQNEIFEHGFSTYIPNCIDIDKYSSVRNMNTREKIEILIVGRWDYVKGTHLVPDVITKIRKYPVRKEVKYSFIGKGATDTLYKKNVLKRLKQSLQGIDYKIIDYVEPEKMPDVYADADIVFVPSLYETHGITAMEGIASGCLVVAPDIGGMSEIVVHNKTGITFKPGDVNDMGSKLVCALEMIGNKMQYMLVENGRRHIEDNYSWRANVGKIISVYNKVLSSK